MRSIEYLKMAGEVKELTRHINFIVEKSILQTREEDYDSEGKEILILAIAIVNTIKDYYGVSLSKKGKKKIEEALEDIRKGRVKKI